MNRIRISSLIIILLCFIAANSFGGGYKECINTGIWTPASLDALLQKSSRIKETGERIDFLSRQFLGTLYKKSTLIGDKQTPEVLVINLAEVDCFTFLDYVEALRLSGSYAEFKDSLRNVRYHSGIVSFKDRNHFFTDWTEQNSAFVTDVTERVGAEKTISIVKLLNGEKQGKQLLPGIPARKRAIKYIPSAALNKFMLEKLQTGDYIGFYSGEKNLDVSHVGIIIKDRKQVLLRHASSDKGKVVDEDFKNYVSRKPGVIVLRPKYVSVHK